MRVVGIAVKVETEGRPTARGLLLEVPGGKPVIVDEFELPGDDVDFARQLFELAEATRSRLQALRPDRVVVCRADFAPAASRKEAPKLRLLAEGAIAAAARGLVPETFLATGQEIGAWDGNGKDAVRAQAKSLVQSAGKPQKWLEAAMAGLGAIAHP